MNNKIVIGLLYLYALVFSVSKTIRFPNQWAEAHWMLDYRFGFIKRGLGGEIFGFFFDKNQHTIALLSFIILFLLYILVFIIAIKQTVKNKGSVNTILFFLIFFLSQYVIYSAHLTGYMDNLIFLSAILIIQLIKSKKIILSSVLASCCILLHELSFFLMIPVCFFALIINDLPKEFSSKNIFNTGLLEKTLLFLLLPLITMILLSVNQELHGIEYYNSIFNYLSHFNFIDKKVVDSVSHAYTETFKDYLISEGPHFLQRVFISKATIQYGIPILFLMLLMYREFKKINTKVLILLALISLLPLLLHAIAYDTYRIWSFPFMVLFLGFWILNSTFENNIVSSEKFSILEITVLIISALLITLIPSPLLNFVTERFSLTERIIISTPVYLAIFIYIRKKTQRNIEA